MLCGGYLFLDEFYRQFSNSDFHDTVRFSLDDVFDLQNREFTHVRRQHQDDINTMSLTP
jgi:hypothetical protein